MYRIAVALSVACLVVFASYAAGETEDALKKKMEKRIDDIQKHKDAGKVGETHEGYLEAVKEDDLKKDKALKKLIEAENADRKNAYGMIAKRLSTKEKKMTVKAVGNNAVKIKFDKAGDKEYFKGKDGKWRTKAQMVEAMKKAREKKKENEKKAAKKN